MISSHKKWLTLDSLSMKFFYCRYNVPQLLLRNKRLKCRIAEDAVYVTYCICLVALWVCFIVCCVFGELFVLVSCCLNLVNEELQLIYFINLCDDRSVKNCPYIWVFFTTWIYIALLRKLLMIIKLVLWRLLIPFAFS